MLPSFLKIAPSLPARTTLRGFHVNLYCQGLSPSHNGSTNPPVEEIKEVTFSPFF